jgi:hypothetical protein
MSGKWKRCRDTVAGGDAVKAAGAAYLPKLHQQTDEDYNAYKARAEFYNATWRTIDGLSGMLFRKDMAVTVPDSVAPMLDDITTSGIPFSVFARRAGNEVLTTGRGGILVDYPPESTEGMTLAEAETRNLRPFLQFYPAESVYNWKTAWINNRHVLTELRLSEQYTYPVDPVKPFDNPKTETRYRVLDLTALDGALVYRVRVYRINDGRNDEQVSETIPRMGGRTIGSIPFVFLGTEDLSPDVDDPSLIDLVDANLCHYRLDADYKHGLHFCGLPTPYVTGWRTSEENKNQKLYIGSSSAWLLTDPQSKAAFLEFTGQGLQPLEKALDRLEQHIAILGARMLSPDRKQAEAAETAQIHRAGEQSVLSKMSGTLAMSLTLALRILTEWAGADPKDVLVELSREFLPVTMDAATLTSYIMGWQSGALSAESLFRKLQQGDVIAAGVTFEEEQEKIASDGPTLPTMNGGGE